MFDTFLGELYESFFQYAHRCNYYFVGEVTGGHRREQDRRLCLLGRLLMFYLLFRLLLKTTCDLRAWWHAQDNDDACAVLQPDAGPGGWALHHPLAASP